LILQKDYQIVSSTKGKLDAISKITISNLKIVS